MKLKSNLFNLVLSGGAALGYAHIGVCEFLNEHNLKPKNYYGVSMGAIVASIEAINITQEEKIKIYLTISKLFKWFSFNLTNSLISFKKIEKIINNIFGNMTFEELNNLYIGATNYKTGEYVTFCRDNNCLIKDAILASMSVPAIFPPKQINNEIYVDGYISSNLPLESINNNLLNLIVNVTGKNSFKKLSNKELLSLSLFKNLERSIRILIYNQTKSELNKFKKSYILIEPKVFEYKTSQFFKFNKIKAKGYEEAKKILL